LLTILTDIGHQRNLGIAFINVGLIDRDRIGPEGTLSELVLQSLTENRPDPWGQAQCDYNID
jgi:hypothetical protein